MTAWVPYECPEDVCKAEQAKGFHERFGKLAARPWNQREARTTMWWLVPFGDDGKSPWPAFGYGKYQFAFSSDRKRIQVGLHVEKGLSAEAAKMLPAGNSTPYKMTSEWRWHRFVGDLPGAALCHATWHVTRPSHGQSADVPRRCAPDASPSAASC